MVLNIVILYKCTCSTFEVAIYGAGAGAEIMDRGGAVAEEKQIRFLNTAVCMSLKAKQKCSKFNIQYYSLFIEINYI